KGPCPFTCSGGTWVLADRRCSDLRYCCKRSRCFQLQRSFWHRQYYDFRRYGQHGICPCFHGIWRSQRLRNDGFLSSLCSMYGNDRNDPQRSGKDKYHCRVRLLPACHCMDFRSDFLPYRTAVLNKRENKDRKSTRLNSSHVSISYAVFCLKKKKTIQTKQDHY